MVNENTLAQPTYLELARRDSSAYVVSARENVASEGGTLTLHLKNPDESNQSIVVQELNAASQFRGDLTIYDELAGSVTGGESVQIDGLLMDSASETPDEPNVDANVNVSFDDTTTPHYVSTFPSGGTGGTTIGGIATATKPIIEPGREIVIEIVNNSTTQRPGAIGIVFTTDASVYSQ